SGVAKHIDDAWNTSAGFGNQQRRLTGKKRTACSNRGQPIIDVTRDVRGAEGLEVEIRGDPLRKLHQLRGPQHILKLRLSNKNDLEKLVFIGIDVRQHPEFFERFQS